jgi:hypothetical protein
MTCLPPPENLNFGLAAAGVQLSLSFSLGNKIHGLRPLLLPGRISLCPKTHRPSIHLDWPINFVLKW